MANWAREWNIVRSEIDFKHVIVPEQTLTLVPAEQDGELGYKISHNGSDSLKSTFLRVRGGTFLPDLATIAGRNSEQLQQNFSNDSVLKDIDDFVHRHGHTLVRLEGAIELPEHARTAGEKKLEFYVYQISNAVRDNRTMVYFQAKITAKGLANGGGSVTGYS